MSRSPTHGTIKCSSRIVQVLAARWRLVELAEARDHLGRASSSRTCRCLSVLIYLGCRDVKHNGGSRNYVLIRFEWRGPVRPV